MNKAELTAKATALGIDLPQGATNADITALIAEKEETAQFETLSATAVELGIDPAQYESAQALGLAIELAQSQSLTEELSSNLENSKLANRNSGVLPVVAYKGKRYQVTAKQFLYKANSIDESEKKEPKERKLRVGLLKTAKVVTAHDLADNPEMIADLVTRKSDILVDVEVLQAREDERKGKVAARVEAAKNED